MKTRVEKDFLGEKEISSSVYWGIHTRRASENFQISSLKVPFCFIEALATVKKAACLTNKELGFLPPDKADAIDQACDEIIAGKLNDQFVLDALQGGAGTSTNMNVNEVVANRSLEILDLQKGDYEVIHPIEHVNLHQSTNDVCPTALKVAVIFKLKQLSREVAELQGSFQRKEKEFAEIVKIGRTELQEAVPMTLGAEFSSFAEAISRDRWRIFKCEERIRVVNMGGTAIGTGMGASREFIFMVIEKLRELTGFGLTRAENMVDATSNLDSFVEVSGMLKVYASNLIKVSNDLRLLNLLGEIRLPHFQAGSSIMPGKVNPVILESVAQTGIKVIANDLMVTEAVSRGSLQINEFLPLIAFALLESLEILESVTVAFSKCVAFIEADHEKCLKNLSRAESLITAFLPTLGYQKTDELLKEFKALRREDLREFLNEKLGRKMVDQVLSPHNLLSLGYRNG